MGRLFDVSPLRIRDLPPPTYRGGAPLVQIGDVTLDLTDFRTTSSPTSSAVSGTAHHHEAVSDSHVGDGRVKL
jgi:hypothetical protein